MSCKNPTARAAGLSKNLDASICRETCARQTHASLPLKMHASELCPCAHLMCAFHLGCAGIRSPFDHELQLLHPNGVNFSTDANTFRASSRPRQTHPTRRTHLSTTKMHAPDACMSGRMHLSITKMHA